MKKGYLVIIGVLVIALTSIAHADNINLALNGIASESSTNYHSAGVAIDGNTDGNFSNGSVTHTYADNPSWWMVDLRATYPISEIVIWNRTDGEEFVRARLSNFNVSILDNFSQVVWSADYFTAGGYPAPSLDILLLPNIAGRFVKVTLHDVSSGDQYLSLAEVQVYGSPTAPVADAGALFTPGPVMNEARMSHHIATLPNGKVIVFGGTAPGFGLSYTADVFDPVANNWTIKAMNYPHDWGAFAKLNDGRYLLAGSMGASGVGQSPLAEIYDPVHNTFTPTGQMNIARTACSGATLANGKVLVVGNWYADASRGELFDPATNTFTLTGPLNTPRALALVLPTNDGGAVVFGGMGTYGSPWYGQVEYYNPATNSFSILRNTLLDDGYLYSVFDNAVEPSSRRLPDGRYILYCWGADAHQVIYTFDPATKQFARFNISPDVLLPGAPWVYSMSVDAARNKVYLLTADAAYPSPSTKIRLYTMDPATGALNSPTDYYDLGRERRSGMPGLMDWDAATVLQDGRVMWTGGCPTPDNYGATNLTFLATPIPVPNPQISVNVNIKPGKCPKYIGMKETAPLYAAISGTADFNVQNIDRASIKIGRDGMAATVLGRFNAYGDMATPYTGPGECWERRDGRTDLIVTFETQKVINTLGLRQEPKNVPLPLKITANLLRSKGGTPVVGRGNVRLMK